MLSTAFTDLVGCQVPIQQAGMGGVATPELARAVADAGGLGMVNMVMQPAGDVATALDGLAGQRPGSIGLNILMPFLDPEVVDVAASRVRVVEFFYADPDAALVERVHSGGALAAWQVGSLAEARAAVDAGCDFIVAQGTEAGGHVRGRASLLPLLDSVLGAVGVPVVAAGGIATARGVAAVLAAGAAAARLGTRFVATPEANAHAEYVAALLRASAEDTVLTEAFSVMWPDAPHRVLRSAVDAGQSFSGDVVAQMSLGAARIGVPKLAVPSPTRDAVGTIAAMALYAGESVAAVTEVVPAGQLVRELADGAERLLRATLRLLTSRSADGPGLAGGLTRTREQSPMTASPPSPDRPANLPEGTDMRTDLDLTQFKALSFDCYGTLIDWEAGIAAVLGPWAREQGLDLDDEELLLAYSGNEAAVEREMPTALYPDVLATAFRRTGDKLHKPVSDQWAQRLGQSVPDWPAFPDSAAALARLARHYQLIILSNVHRDGFAGSNRRLRGNFAAIITAEDVGAYKPAPNHFRALDIKLAGLGLDHKDLLHAAQSLFHDHVPAKRENLPSVWINRRHDRPGWGATPEPSEEWACNLEFSSMADFACAVDQAFDVAASHGP